MRLAASPHHRAALLGLCILLGIVSGPAPACAAGPATASGDVRGTALPAQEGGEEAGPVRWTDGAFRRAAWGPGMPPLPAGPRLVEAAWSGRAAPHGDPSPPHRSAGPGSPLQARAPPAP
jgi:hypothetical protein